MRTNTRPAAAPATQHVRRRGYTWQKRCILAGIVGMVGISVALVAMPGLGARFRGTMHTPPDRAALLSALAELKAAWNPAERERVIDEVRQRGASLDQAFHWVLAQPTHRYVEQAIDLSGELRVGTARDDLMQLTKQKSLRAAAMTAADRIEPLSGDELGGLFATEDKDLLLAAVAIAVRREARPVAALLQLLHHPDRDVRQAALAALPKPMASEFEAPLLGIAGDPEADVAVCGLQALSNLPFTASTEAFLVEAMERREPAVTAAAQATLGHKGGPLGVETQRQLWSLITDPGADRSVVALAFLALERTGSVDAAEVESRSFGLDAFGRYFAARLLIRIGRHEGVQQLFDLLAELGGDNRQLRFAAMTLLAGLAKMHVSDGEAALRAWFEAHPWTAPQELPAPPLDL